MNQPRTHLPSTSKKRFRAALLAAAMWGLLASAATAQSPPQHAKIELIVDQTPPRANARLQAGLLFHLDPGWHIYWRNPGDSGEPPKIIWDLPAYFIPGNIEWPAPKCLGSGSIIDYGYENEVLLIIPLHAPTANSAAAPASQEIAAEVKYIVCREICIPGKQHLELSLPLRDALQSAKWHKQFEQARQQIPRPAPAAWKISARAARNNLVLTIANAPQTKSATFFPQAASVIENSAPQTLATDAAGIHLTLRMSDQSAGPPAQLKGVLVLDGARAYEIAAPVVKK